MALPNNSDLKKLTKFCRQNGILSIKSDGFELVLSPTSLFPSTNKQPEDNADPKIEGAYTDEEILMWSSAGIPEEKTEQ